MDFFEHQHKAKQKTKLLVFYFVLAVVLIITVLNVVIFQLGNNSGQFQLTAKQWFSSPWFAGISLGTVGVIFLGSLIRGIQISGGGQSVAKMVNARAISMDTKDKLERRLINVVEEMSIASGTAIPSLFVMDEEKGMNAFVAGLVPSDTVLVVTQGLLENLDRQELQGVVAHEYSHIFNSDMRMNVRLIAILGGILALGQLGYFLLRSLRYSGRRRSSSSSSNQSGLVIIGAAVALLVVGYIGLFFGRLIKAAISRQREFLADASAVQFSRDSMGIANALYRIKTNGKGSLLDSSHAEDMSHMCFGSALKFTAFSGLLATHPPIDERIKTLVPGYRPQKSSPHQSSNTDTDTDSVTSSFSEGQSSVVLEDALEIRTAEQMIEQIGQLNPEQLAKAEAIHKSIPEQLHNAAHDSSDAAKLILALITANSDGSTDDLFQPIKNRLTESELKTVSAFSEIIENLSDDLLLPLVNMTIPALKQSNAQQKKDLLATASLLISADKKIKPFEFFLYALLRKNLSKKDAVFSNTTYRKYKPVLNEIQFLLSVIAEAGEENTEEIVSLAMKSFDHNWQAPATLPTYNAAQLNKSLQKLNQLTHLLKKPLMQTMAEIAMDDGEIKRSEVELIRAAGIYLECPVPPLF